MVLQNRLDYGFNGYQVPATPRAARSARRRGSFKKKVEENQICAFDLLATVAGKLLLEGERSPTTSNTSSGKDRCVIVKEEDKKDRPHEEKPLKVEPCDQGSCDRSSFVSELDSQTYNQNCSLKESPHHQNDNCSGLASVITSSVCSGKVSHPENLGIGEGKNEIGSLASKVDVGSFECMESSDHNLEDETKRQINVETHKSGKVLIGTGADMCNSDDPVVWDGKPLAQVSSDSSAKVPLCRDHSPRGSFPLCRDDVKLVSRDDDENSSGCTHPSTTTKSFRSAPRIGDRRIRKLLASKYWKFAPKLKDEELSNTGGELKPIYRNRKTCYRRQRSQRNYPFKRRKLFDRSSVSNSDGGISSEGISYSFKNGIDGDVFGLGPKMHGATGTSSVAGQNKSFQSRDSHVKLRIKSFRVPELFIEIPETATVGSLKRTVMEAVTAILGGGLHVGVLLQGKKVRDDNKTLLQTGISHDNQLDALGFTLEPNSSQTPPPICPGDSPFLLPCDTPQPLTRYPPPPPPAVVHHGTSDALPDPPMTNLGNFVDSDHDSAPSPTDMSIDKSVTDSKALVAVPAMSVEALAVVPMHRKSKRSEAQRRIRRPFSVTEVEALVQAVEKLGTGRYVF
ncbi:hypothetical protein L1049_013262 [Liquidambar formosana]|uniref:HTH myb-type domain-containing protein n=1 Tax=Liquidambar formosana TaxID=63359 RepID=A0AAP0RLM1_LIQFO